MHKESLQRAALSTVWGLPALATAPNNNESTPFGQNDRAEKLQGHMTSMGLTRTGKTSAIAISQNVALPT